MAQPPQRTVSLSTFVFPHSQLMDEQERFVSLIIQSIEDALYNKNHTQVSIFIVPKTLMLTAPTSYIPQHVSLGPNHCWRPELHDMEDYKISAAKNIQKHISGGLTFKRFVEEYIKRHESRIRASYQRFIYFKEEYTLAWVMAIDTAYLLEFLQLSWLERVAKQASKERLEHKKRTPIEHGEKSSAIEQGEKSTAIEQGEKTTPVEHEIYVADADHQQPGAAALSALKMARILSISIDEQVHNYRNSVTTRNAMVRDIVMLENQIPLFLLMEMLQQVRYLSENGVSADQVLYVLLKGFLKKACPFEFLADRDQPTDVPQPLHILDYLYRTILPKSEEESSQPPDDCKIESEKKRKSIPWANLMRDKTAPLLSTAKNLLTKFRLPRKVNQIISPITVVLTLAVGHLSKMVSSSESCEDDDKPPEIDIPSATELARAGVRFSPIQNGKNFSDINFDSKKAIFELPAITLDENTEVVLRNLVAYEATSPSASLYFTRYTELMNGIIDTAEDIKILKDRNIIRNKMKNDEVAAQMWNLMSRSIKKKKVNKLDDVIVNVKKYYYGRWKIKVETFMRQYVYDSWQFLAFLATVLLLLFEMFDAFCSVYDCTTLFHFKH